MAWQNFPQFDLYNTTLAHTAVTPATPSPGASRGVVAAIYNLSHPQMRAAWVGALTASLASGAIDGFFIDITPQALPDWKCFTGVCELICAVGEGGTGE